VHGAELDEPKWTLPPADALLNEKERAWRCDKDDHRRGDPQRKCCDQHHERHRDVQAALDDFVALATVTLFAVSHLLSSFPLNELATLCGYAARQVRCKVQKQSP
jgi:hypothetical protein